MGDVLQFGQQIAQTGLLGRKAQMGAAAMHVANTDTSSKSGGILGTAAASGRARSPLGRTGEGPLLGPATRC